MRLLAHKYKKWGFICLLAGSVFAALNLTGCIRLESPVFAVYSGFLEQKLFSVSYSNLTDELAIVFLLSGLAIISLTAEASENEQTKQARYKAMLYATGLNYLLLSACTLLVYGSGFAFVLVTGLFSQAVIYLVSFGIIKTRVKKD